MTLTTFAIAITALTVALATRRRTMEEIERIKRLLAELNTAITTEAAQVKAKLQELRDLLDSGAAPKEELLAIADSISASIDRVKGIVPDEAPESTTGEGESATT